MQTVAMADDGSVVTTYNNNEYAPRASWNARVAQKLERWSFLYNVTTGLYMLDGWERCLCNAIVLVLLFFLCYNGGHYIARFLAWCGDDGDFSSAKAQWFESVEHLRTVALGALGGGPRRN